MTKKTKIRLLVSTHVDMFEKEGLGTVCTFKECPNEEWGFINEYKGYWKAVHIRSGLRATEGSTKAECVEKLKQIFTQPVLVDYIHNVKSIDEALEEFRIRKEKTDKLKEEFLVATGFPLPICPLTGGADVIKLDSMLNVPDGTSTHEFIKNKYGERIATIVEELI